MGIKTTIHGRHTTAIEVLGDDSRLIIAADAEITVVDALYAVSTAQGYGHNHVMVRGAVSSLSAFPGAGIGLIGNFCTLTIGNSGEVSGSYGAVLRGDYQEFKNSGTISSEFGPGAAGVLIRGSSGQARDSHITNSGVISGHTALDVAMNEGWISNQSGGKLLGDNIGIAVSDGSTEIINHGLIKTTGYSIYVGDSAAAIHISNDGRLIGNVWLSRGDDVIDMRGGSIKGVILGLSGEDTLFTDNARIKLAESAGDPDYDTVRSSVSYTLNANVEILWLTGSKNINATGNDGENYLYGNRGNNVLNGKGGYNEMFGFAGKDTLIGGDGQDLFGFGKGFGRDTVKGFQHGTDDIDIYHLGPDSYRELKPHIEKHGADTWIEFGKDVLILKGIDPGTLDAGDFIFDLHW